MWYSRMHRVDDLKKVCAIFKLKNINSQVENYTTGFLLKFLGLLEEQKQYTRLKKVESGKFD